MIQETTRRDQLARERTVMANERTLLAYGRTALAVLGLAVLIFKFTDSVVSIPLGLVVLLSSLSIFLWGIRSYRLAQLRISGEEEVMTALSLAEAD